MTKTPLFLRSMACALVTTLAALILTGTGSGLRADELYRPPDLDKELFDVTNIDFGRKGTIDKTALLKNLVRIASDFDEEDDVDFELRAHALGIAGRIDPESEAFKTTHEQLKENSKAYGKEGTPKSRVVGGIREGVRALLRIKGNEDNKKCAAYCLDIAIRFDTDEDSRYRKWLEEQLSDLKADDIEVDWEDTLGDAVVPDSPFSIFRSSGRMEPREEKMPGGKAETFAARQRSIYGLVVVTLPGGKHAGAASEIVASALKEGNKGVEFKIDMKVGDMMGNSLKSIVDYLRVNYADTGKVPEGYTVKIVFEDRDTLTDGPSAGTAMALMLDALFTGEELDDGFACTGGITPAGKVTKIGGVAAKIRGATRRDCKIVGVPQGNAKGVNDILVLKGVEPLCDIQIFTMKDIEQARAISRKEKDDTVASTLADFKLVADLIREEGADSLKNAKVQEKLEGVIEKMPNHQSAQLLLDYGRGKAPKRLSVGGSFHEIDTTAAGIYQITQGMVFRDNYDHSQQTIEQAKGAVEELEELEKIVDARFEDYVESALKLCKLVEEGKGDDDEEVFLKRLKSRWESLQSQREKLSKDPEVREEIMG